MSDEEAKAFLTEAAARPAGSYVEITLDDLREKCGHRKRTEDSVAHMRRLLDDAGLVTEPDFVEADRRALLRLVPDSDARTTAEAEPEAAEDTPESDADEFRFPPVAPKVSDIPSACSELISITRESTIAEACDLLFHHDIGQLPVLSGPAVCHSMVTWKSLMRAQVVNPDATIRDCEEEAVSVPLDANLIDQLGKINTTGVAFVHRSDDVYCGVVTAREVTEYLSHIVEPFYVLGEIERRLRHRLNQVFTAEDFAPYGTNKKPVRNADDMMFWQYLSLLSDPDRFARLGWPTSCERFQARLDAVRKIRNSVMHFNADIIEPAKLNTLFSFLKSLRDLQRRHEHPPSPQS